MFHHHCIGISPQNFCVHRILLIYHRSLFAIEIVYEKLLKLDEPAFTVFPQLQAHLFSYSHLPKVLLNEWKNCCGGLNTVIM